MKTVCWLRRGEDIFWVGEGGGGDWDSWDFCITTSFYKHGGKTGSFFSLIPSLSFGAIPINGSLSLREP